MIFLNLAPYLISPKNGGKGIHRKPLSRDVEMNVFLVNLLTAVPHHHLAHIRRDIRTRQPTYHRVPQGVKAFALELPALPCFCVTCFHLNRSLGHESGKGIG